MPSDLSPIDGNVIWAGTDDGNVQVTRDGGATWTNVVGNMRGVAEGAWVPQLTASKHDPAEAFVVFDDHRRNNWEPYVYRTRDYGASWQRLADGDNVWGYALALAQDPVASNLLFLGTEFGLYISIDDGATWTQFTNGYPTASTMDLVIHPRDHDLVIGTFGRSIYIVDDIRPLRAMAQEGADLLDAPLAVFDAPDAYQAIYRQATGTRFAAASMFAGENRPRGAMLTYVVNPQEQPAVAMAGTNGTNGSRGSEMAAEARAGGMANGKKDDKVKIEIVNSDGEVIRTLQGPAEPGINRTYWGMRQKGIRFGGGFGGGGQQRRDVEPPGASVLPGMYTARISYGDYKDSTTVNVMFDPRMEVNRADLEARMAMYKRWETHAKVANDATTRLRKARETIGTVNKQLGDRDDEPAKALKKQGREVQKTIGALTERFSGKQDIQGFTRDPATVMSRLFTARSYIQSGLNAPDPSADIALGQAREALEAVIGDVNGFFEGDWAAYQQAVEAAAVSLFETHEPLEVEGQ